MQFSPFSCYFIFLRSKHSPQHFVVKTFNLCSSLMFRDSVLHPWEDKDPELNNSNHMLNLVCL